MIVLDTERIEQLLELSKRYGQINAVRFMLNKEDVDYAHKANEVEVSFHSGNSVRYFSLDEGAEDWVETV